VLSQVEELNKKLTQHEKTTRAQQQRVKVNFGGTQTPGGWALGQPWSCRWLPGGARPSEDPHQVPSLPAGAGRGAAGWGHPPAGEGGRAAGAAGSEGAGGWALQGPGTSRPRLGPGQRPAGELDGFSPCCPRWRRQKLTTMPRSSRTRTWRRSWRPWSTCRRRTRSSGASRSGWPRSCSRASCRPRSRSW